MDELATVKSAFPSVVTHSDALEFHSLFSTVYAPPATAAVCELHRVVEAAWAAPELARVSEAVAASVAAATAIGLSIRLLMGMQPGPFIVRHGSGGRTAGGGGA